MTGKDKIDMHHDHVLWNSDIRMWNQDLETWEMEMDALKDAFKVIKKAIDNHEAALMNHKEVIRSHYDHVNNHETDLSLIPSTVSSLDKEMTAKHQGESYTHRLQMDAHERLKRYHHSILVLTKNLKQGLESAI